MIGKGLWRWWLAGWVAMLWAGPGCAAEPNEKLMLPEEFKRLLPLHTTLGRPQPREWLAEHYEPGQTYAQYVRSQPVKPDRQRRVIYVQPLGDFNRTQRRIVTRTAEFVGIYFDLPVRIRRDLPLKLIPENARRVHPTWGDNQVLTTYVLNDVLRPQLPKDAAIYIALTTSDLWPGKGWNFVFGQASLRERVGVWSIYRNGNPDESDAALRLCLLRTLRTATHEMGHMFSMMHCTLYECNMCGSNHRAESDRRPLALCPHCLAKLCYATGADPRQRFRKLITFCKDNGLGREQEFFEKSLAALHGS
jgi:archaemetzincin